MPNLFNAIQRTFALELNPRGKIIQKTIGSSKKIAQTNSFANGKLLRLHNFV